MVGLLKFFPQQHAIAHIALAATIPNPWNVIEGTEGPDGVPLHDDFIGPIFDTAKSDIVHLYGGNDVFYGVAGGNDWIYGGYGNDSITAGDGNDVLFGEIGDDFLFGGGGNDDLSGGDGKDILFGGRGSDTLDGGIGDDYLMGDGTAGAPAEIVGLFGDTAEANQDDTLFGGLGNDHLYGGWGVDHLYGGGGADAFYIRIVADGVLSTQTEIRPGALKGAVDFIMDFSGGNPDSNNGGDGDRLHIDVSNFGGIVGQPSPQFHNTTDADYIKGEFEGFLYNVQTHDLQYETGSSSFVLVHLNNQVTELHLVGIAGTDFIFG